MKTTIIAICLIIGGFFGFGFSKSGNEHEKDGKVTVKIVTEKNGVTTVIDTTLTFTGEFNESIITDLLKSYGIDESGAEGGKTLKNIIVNTNEEGQGKHVKMVCISGDTSLAQIMKCCSTPGDSLQKCCSRQTCTVVCDEKDGKKQKKMCILSNSGNCKELKDCMNKEINVEVNEDGTMNTITVNGESVNLQNVDADVQVINNEDGKKVIIIKAKVNIDDLDKNDLVKLDNSTGINPTGNNLKIEKLDFYPNPNNGKFNLSFTLPEKGNTKITVFDSNGKEVYKEILSDFTGEYNKAIDISAEGKGMYFLNVEQGSKVMNKKLVIK